MIKVLSMPPTNEKARLMVFPKRSDTRIIRTILINIALLLPSRYNETTTTILVRPSFIPGTAKKAGI